MKLLTCVQVLDEDIRILLRASNVGEGMTSSVVLQAMIKY